jgi:hypothetical protein
MTRRGGMLVLVLVLLLLLMLLMSVVLLWLWLGVLAMSVFSVVLSLSELAMLRMAGQRPGGTPGRERVKKWRGRARGDTIEACKTRPAYKEGGGGGRGGGEGGGATENAEAGGQENKKETDGWSDE